MNENYADFLNMISLVVSLMNLSENREQSAHNDIQAANQEQAQFLLEEINRRFEEQNQMLRQILDKLKNLNI